MVRVLFFGKLRDAAGTSAVDIAQPGTTIVALRDLLGRENDALAAALNAPGVRAAADKSFCANNASLANVSEVAFMPPLSGG